MKEQEKAVVTVVGRDKIGILAKVSGAVADVNGNVLDVTQSVLEDFFCMIMVIDVKDTGKAIDEVQTIIAERVPEMQVHVMHEAIFNSMHRI